MYPIIFTLGSFTFYTHGAFAVLGIIVATLTIYLLSKRKLDCTNLFDNIVYSVLIGIIVARITFFLLYHSQISSILLFFQFWRGGLVSYGGFIAGALAFALLLKLQKQPVLSWFDMIAIAFPLGLSIARLGESISGEDFGVVIYSFLSVRGFVPISLFEAVWCLTIFVTLITIYKKTVHHRNGIFAVFLILLYTAGRFIIDFWRDESKIVVGISLGQIISLLLFITAVALLMTNRHKQRGKHEAF